VSVPKPSSTPPPDEPGHRIAADEIVSIVNELGDMVGVLREAQPTHRAEVYERLGPVSWIAASRVAAGQIA
jgi:hypothetical protein